MWVWAGHGQTQFVMALSSEFKFGHDLAAENHFRWEMDGGLVYFMATTDCAIILLLVLCCVVLCCCLTGGCTGL
jgi:hypothetical protein